MGHSSSLMDNNNPARQSDYITAAKYDAARIVIKENAVLLA